MGGHSFFFVTTLPITVKEFTWRVKISPIEYPLTRRVRRKILNGEFPSQLSSKEGTLRAIESLVDSTSGLMIVCQGPKFNYDLGTPVKEPNLVLDKKDWVESKERVFQKLQEAREAKLVVRFKDNGAAVVDLTQRKWEPLSTSESLECAMLDFGRSLKNDGRNRYITPGWATLLGFAPILAYFLIGFIDFFAALLFNQKIRTAYIEDGETPKPFIYLDLDISIIVKWVLISWPIFILACIAIYAIRAYSGALRIWPEGLNENLFHMALYRMRTALTSSIFPELGNRLIFMIFGAVILYILTGNLQFSW